MAAKVLKFPERALPSEPNVVPFKHNGKPASSESSNGRKKVKKWTLLKLLKAVMLPVFLVVDLIWITLVFTRFFWSNLGNFSVGALALAALVFSGEKGSSSGHVFWMAFGGLVALNCFVSWYKPILLKF